METVFQKQMNQFFEPLPMSNLLRLSLDQKRLHAECKNKDSPERDHDQPPRSEEV